MSLIGAAIPFIYGLFSLSGLYISLSLFIAFCLYLFSQLTLLEV
jgi:cell division protein FtsX